MSDFVIVGAGICGLSIARKLASYGYTINLLEARRRAGGRINTVKWHFDQLVETGAEFIHGNLPLTFQLAEEAGATIIEVKGDIYKSSDNKVFKTKDFIENRERFLKELNKEIANTTLGEFLKTHLTSEKDIEMRKSVIRQAEGFDAAHPDRISIFSLRDEWKKDNTPFIIKEGYSFLIDFLLEECMNNGCELHFSKIVKLIKQHTGSYFSISCDDGTVYETKNVIITVPPGILTAPPEHPAHIDFIPGIPEALSAAAQLGYGNVVKVVIEFKQRFWEKEKFKYECAHLPAYGFLIGEGTFPISWANRGAAIISAWAGGKQCDEIKKLSDEEIFECAMHSLAESFVASEDFLRSQLLNYKVYNWSNNIFTSGAYCYETLSTKSAKQILSGISFRNIFFAGEAFGKTTGTVEAALESAMDTLQKIKPCQ